MKYEESGVAQRMTAIHRKVFKPTTANKTGLILPSLFPTFIVWKLEFPTAPIPFSEISFQKLSLPCSNER